MGVLLTNDVETKGELFLKKRRNILRDFLQSRNIRIVQSVIGHEVEVIILKRLSFSVINLNGKSLLLLQSGLPFMTTAKTIFRLVVAMELSGSPGPLP